jgi:predicted dienelactone hydrolase
MTVSHFSRRAAMQLPAAFPIPVALAADPRRAEVAAEAAGSRQDWHDAARGRTVPVLLRWPDAQGPVPTVVISHGLGGSREGLAYLGRALAQAGFLALHLQHPGSDSAIWQGQPNPAAALGRAVRDPRVAMARLQDIPFALDELFRRHGGRVDTSRLAIAGHSFGAWTAQHALGQALPLPVAGLPERRLRAGVLLSPVPGWGPPRLEALRAPLLHITGTEDWTMVDGAGPEERLAVFRAAAGVRQAAVVLHGATHLAFAGIEEAGAGRAGHAFHARAASLATLFLQAILPAAGIAASEFPAEAARLLRGEDTLAFKEWI